MLSGYLFLIGIGVCAAAVFVGLGRAPAPRPSRRSLAAIAEFATVSSYLSIHPTQTAKAMALAIAMSAMNGIAIWLIGLAYGTGTDFTTALIASPVVFLVAMIPISIAGWGLREGAFVVAFGLFGVSSADALAVSVTFGIAVLFAYAPAVVLLLRARRQSAHVPTEPGYAPGSSPRTGRS